MLNESLRSVFIAVDGVSASTCAEMNNEINQGAYRKKGISPIVIRNQLKIKFMSYFSSFLDLSPRIDENLPPHMFTKWILISALFLNSASAETLNIVNFNTWGVPFAVKDTGRYAEAMEKLDE